MSKLIGDSWNSKDIFITCDCESEGLYIFKDLEYDNTEPLFGFKYFQSYNRKNLKDYYYEFADLEEFKLFINSLTPFNELNYICLRNYYGAYLGWEDNSLIINIHKFNKKIKPSKKPIISISLDLDKCRKLKKELNMWIK